MSEGAECLKINYVWYAIKLDTENKNDITKNQSMLLWTKVENRKSFYIHFISSLFGSVIIVTQESDLSVLWASSGMSELVPP